MSKKFFALLFIVSVFLFISLPIASAQEQNKVTVYLFYGAGCPHCAREKVFLQGLQQKYPTLEVREHEVWYDAKNKALYQKFADAYETYNGDQVPRTFISDKVFIGFDERDANSLYLPEYKAFHGYRNQIENEIERCIENVCPTPKDVLEGRVKAAHGDGDGEVIISVPFFGEINASTTPLPILTAMLGLIDGFNACAMFVLLVLLGILVRTRSRKRLALIASIFVFVSGLMYFLFMTVWLNLFHLIGSVAVAFTVIGVIALIVGIIDVKDFFFFGKGPTLSIPEKAKPKIFERMREIIQAESLPLMLGAAIVLAISVNFIEFLCTFGIPMVYTKVLAEQNIPVILKYFYMALYQVFYMLDDSIMVIIAVVTLSSKRMTETYGRWLKLIAGAIMIGLGLILIFNPQLLVFG